MLLLEVIGKFGCVAGFWTWLTPSSEFDGKGFVSGIQVMATAYSNVMQTGGTGEVPGIGNVLTTVVGNENPKFAPVANRRDMTGKFMEEE